MSGGLVALLDDVATLARMAAASVDDVGAAAGRASAKAAGVVVALATAAAVLSGSSVGAEPAPPAPATTGLPTRIEGGVELAAAVAAHVEERHPHVDVAVHHGGQPRYPLLVSVE